ncbi:hypothetical protein ZIOFF_010774 [Zingiber officinale]|uniref:dUTP diphosphatase n=1 Tax=Zingiber officinale TaxID=94328 RepID=A0A8J5I6X4_ZINOF|nr:hypothetical protein ZIOFF_010774 [Zingiber officinale]
MTSQASNPPVTTLTRTRTEEAPLFEDQVREYRQNQRRRQEEGTLALIVFRDNRWQGDQAIFATMEVDLTYGSQLVYVIPDTIHGVRDLPGRRYNTREVQGHNWIIRQSTVSIPMQPTEVNTRNLLDGSVSLQFDTYQAATSSSQRKYNAKDEEVPYDEEEITNHIIAVLTETGKGDEELLVRRISASAVLPVRRSHGAAGYDLAIDYAKNIAPNERRLLAIGICIQIPEGLYARIAPRSSAALRGIIIMGGVIDTDYRGEIKILAYNTTNEDIYLEEQECIAQLILEHIAMPQVKEVETLQQTARGGQGFGSTTIQVCSKYKANPQCNGCYYCYSDEEYAQEYDFYVAKENTLKLKGKVIQTTNKRRLDTLSRKARDYRVTQHKFYEEEAYLNLIEGPPTMASSLAQTARMLQDSREYRRRLIQELDSQSPPTNFLCMTMDASRKRLFSLSSSGGSINTAEEEARYQGIPTPEGPYQLLDQYEELSRGRSPSPRIFGPQEKDLRAHLEDIEWTASRHVLNSIWELKLINDAKKADFEYQGQLRGGLYFKDSLSEVTKAGDELLDLFIKAQNILQCVRDAPP